MIVVMPTATTGSTPPGLLATGRGAGGPGRLTRSRRIRIACRGRITTTNRARPGGLHRSPVPVDGDRRRRGIAGLSMGGYGASTLAVNYPDVFSAARATGRARAIERRGRIAVPSRPSTSTRIGRRGLRALGAPRAVFGKDSVAWRRGTRRRWPQNAQQAAPDAPALFVDCGTEDVFCLRNRASVTR